MLILATRDAVTVLYSQLWEQQTAVLTTAHS